MTMFELSDRELRLRLDRLSNINKNNSNSFDDFKICPDFDCDCFTMNFQQVIGCWKYKPECNCIMLLRFKEANR